MNYNDFIANTTYYFFILFMGTILYLFITNIRDIIIYFREKRIFDKKMFLFLLVIMTASFLINANFNRAEFGKGENIQESIEAYYLYKYGKWMRCEGGRLDRCVLTSSANYPIGYSFYLSILYYVFGFPLSNQDFFFINTIGVITLFLYYIYTHLLTKSYKIGISATLLFGALPAFSLLIIQKQSSIINIFFLLLSQIFLIMSLEIKNPSMSLLSFGLIILSFTIRPNSIILITTISLFYLALSKKKLNIPLLTIQDKKNKVVFVILVLSLIIISVGNLSLSLNHLQSEYTGKLFSEMTTQAFSLIFIFSEIYMISILFLTGLLISLIKKRNKRNTIYLFFWILFSTISLLIYSPGGMIPQRYVIEIFPPLIIFASIGLVNTVNLLPKGRPLRIMFLCLLLALVLFSTFECPSYEIDNQEELIRTSLLFPEDYKIITSTPKHKRLLILSGREAYDIDSIIHSDDIVFEEKELIYVEDKSNCRSDLNRIDNKIISPLCINFSKEYNFSTIKETKYYLFKTIKN